MKNSYPFFTIGHSTRPINEFIAILINENINCVVDIRSIPGSNKNPQYNKETLADVLKLNKINYKHIANLGGLRKKTANISSDFNAFWQNKSFHNYADYAAYDNRFQDGLDELIKLGYKYRCAIMCAEVLWWRCHRRIVTDYLLLANKKVYHIIDSNNIREAVMTSEGCITNSKTITYPFKS